jgi:hypothetical protein
MKVRLFAVLPLGAMLLFAKASVSKRMEDATSAFKEIMAVPERTISQELLARSSERNTAAASSPAERKTMSDGQPPARSVSKAAPSASRSAARGPTCSCS